MSAEVQPSPHHLVEDYRRFLAGKMRDELVLYSATPEFQELVDELGKVLNINRAIAADLLIPVARGMVETLDAAIPDLVK